MALQMVGERLPGSKRITLGGDKGYDTKDFFEECGRRNVTPHVAQNGSMPIRSWKTVSLSSVRFGSTSAHA